MKHCAKCGSVIGVLSTEDLCFGCEIASLRARLAEAQADLARYREKADRIVEEAYFVLSGGDNPHERCSDCGCAPYGMLRDALSDYKKLRSLAGTKEGT